MNLENPNLSKIAACGATFWLAAAVFSGANALEASSDASSARANAEAYQSVGQPGEASQFQATARGKEGERDHDLSEAEFEVGAAAICVVLAGVLRHNSQQAQA